MYAKAFSVKTGVNTATHSFSIFLMKEIIIFYKRYLEWYEHFTNYFQTLQVLDLFCYAGYETFYVDIACPLILSIKSDGN